MFVPRSMLLRLLFVFPLLSFAASCRAVPAFPSPPSAAAGTPTTGPENLVLWHSETGAARKELEALARDFHAAYPDLTVTPVYVGGPNDLVKQVTAAIALSRTPDLVLASRRDLAQFVRQGGMTPLDSLRDDPSIGFKEEDLQDFFPGILDEGTFVEFGKQLYGFPFDLQGMALFYNAQVIAKPPATWNGFVDQASKATQDRVYGWAMNLDAEIFSGMLVSQGSAMIDDPERRTLFAERGGVAAMTLASQLYKSGAAKVMNDADGAAVDFVLGRAVFYIGWMSQLPELKQAEEAGSANFQIGIANLPQADPAEPFMLVRGSDLAIFRIPPARARNAWFFIRWLTASPQVAQWTRAVNAIPLRSSSLAFLSTDAATLAQLREIENSLNGRPPHFVPLSANRHAAQIEASMENAWAQIVLDKADVPSTLAGASMNSDQLLAGNP